MKSIGEKIRIHRERHGWTQNVLAEKSGISSRTILKYEKDEVNPRPSNIKKLADVLEVTTSYLMNPDIEDSDYGKEEAAFVDAARAVYGSRGARDMEALLQENCALLAGGDIPQEDKDAFFQAVLEAYMTNRREASERFNPHKNGK